MLNPGAANHYLRIILTVIVCLLFPCNCLYFFKFRLFQLNIAFNYCNISLERSCKAGGVYFISVALLVENTGNLHVLSPAPSLHTPPSKSDSPVSIHDGGDVETRGLYFFNFFSVKRYHKCRVKNSCFVVIFEVMDLLVVELKVTPTRKACAKYKITLLST